MQIYLNANLQPYHTFHIEQYCRILVEVTTTDELADVFHRPEWQSLPKIILGQGSNVLFTTFYDGVVIINRLKGLSVQDDGTDYHVYVNAGEDWPDLVENLTLQGIAGLENLAMIPGCAGSAPIQNIGAYGVEFKDVCEYVDCLCLQTFQVRRLSKDECCFGYRDSVFKHRLYQKAIIVGIGLVLPKQWNPRLNYGALSALAPDAGYRDVFEHVCHVRRNKLPDPAIHGNAGSFFKNPVVSEAQFAILKKSFPDIINYPQSDGVKLAAGWLIDQCGLKGTQIGGAQVHPQQALVLVNHNHATSGDIIRLAGYVSQQVFERYSVCLEHEVRFIGATEETCLKEVLTKGVPGESTSD